MAMDQTCCMCQIVIEIDVGSSENVLWVYGVSSSSFKYAA